MTQVEAPRVKTTLQVRQQGGGEPRWYARWRWNDGEREVPVTRGLDVNAWMVKVGEPGARQNGRTVGSWRVRAGRPPEGWLEPDDAYLLVRGVVQAWWEGLRAAEVAREAAADVTVGQALDEYVRLGTEGPDDDDVTLGIEQNLWSRSYAQGQRDHARRVARSLGADRPLRELTTDQVRAFMQSLRPMRNGEVVEEDAPDFEPSDPVEDETDDEREVRLEADEERREEEAVAWRVKRLDNLKKQRSNYAPVVRGATRYALRRGWIEADPCVGLPAYPAPRKRADDPLRQNEFLTREQVRDVVAAMCARADDYALEHPPLRSGTERLRLDTLRQDSVAVLLMAHAGLRPSEALALRWRDVGPDSLTVVQARVRGRTKAPKSGSGRSVPATRPLREALDELRRLRPRTVGDGDLVLAGRGGRHVDLTELRGRFREAQVAAGVSPARHVRQLRNTFGTALAADGMPLRTLQAYMGHSSITVTERYASFSPRTTDAERIARAFEIAEAPDEAPSDRAEPDEPLVPVAAMGSDEDWDDDES